MRKRGQSAWMNPCTWLFAVMLQRYDAAANGRCSTIVAAKDDTRQGYFIFGTTCYRVTSVRTSISPESACQGLKCCAALKKFMCTLQWMKTKQTFLTSRL